MRKKCKKQKQQIQAMEKTPKQIAIEGKVRISLEKSLEGWMEWCSTKKLRPYENYAEALHSDRRLSKFTKKRFQNKIITMRTALKYATATYQLLENKAEFSTEHNALCKKTIEELVYYETALMMTSDFYEDETYVAADLESIYDSQRESKSIDAVLEIFQEYTKDISRLVTSMDRHFVLHIGPTNSGKTHDSLEALRNAATGTYLAPLRLLALEVQERMLSHGTICSLSTGEEEDIIEEATHMSSTVEKANFAKEYDVCVIDECQMIAEERGAFWVKAILGIKAREIHLCGAANCAGILQKLIAYCGCTCAVMYHERNTPLVFQPTPITFAEVEAGDALIVFSKNKVLSVSSRLEKIGLKTSVVYGALPYGVRKRQLNDFIEGKTQVVVSTDAIGMGVNIPIKRIVFCEMEKFDGKTRRPLLASEVQQIAGRAGRRGIYDCGYVTVLQDVVPEVIGGLLQGEVEDIEELPIPFPEELLDLKMPLEYILRRWSGVEFEKPFSACDMNKEADLAKSMQVKVRKRMAYKLVTLPFDYKISEIGKYWSILCLACAQNRKTVPKPYLLDETLESFEFYNKKLDLYHSFAKSFDLQMDAGWLAREKARVLQNIAAALVEKEARRCRVCGKELPWDTRYNICDACFAKRHM